jgi:hypothetical protein
MSLPFDLDSSIPDQDLESSWYDPPPVPRTFQDALDAWERVRDRNLRIRERFQSTQKKGVLLRSAVRA